MCHMPRSVRKGTTWAAAGYMADLQGDKLSRQAQTGLQCKECVA